MNYCSHCGAKVAIKTPEGDHLPRFVCESCEMIHYQNPKIVAGCIPAWEDRILLCRRAIQPRYGLWTLPAGFMENHESTEQAALRETHEEAGADMQIDSLFAMLSIPYISQVYIMFRGTLRHLEFNPGPESLEVQLFREAEIPWQELAFPVVVETLKRYFADVKRGQFTVHVGDIHKMPPKPAP